MSELDDMNRLRVEAVRERDDALLRLSEWQDTARQKQEIIDTEHQQTEHQRQRAIDAEHRLDALQKLDTLPKLRLVLEATEAERDDALLRLSSCEKELEDERMKLGACGVAASQNTELSRSLHRLPEDSPYRCASYEDVCAAVDREMELRAQLKSVHEEYALARKLLVERTGEKNEVQQALDTTTIAAKDTVEQLEHEVATAHEEILMLKSFMREVDRLAAEQHMSRVVEKRSSIVEEPT